MREQIAKIVIGAGGKVLVLFLLLILMHSQLLQIKDALLDSDYAVLKTTAKRKLNSLPFHVKPLFYQVIYGFTNYFRA